MVDQNQTSTSEEVKTSLPTAEGVKAEPAKGAETEAVKTQEGEKPPETKTEAPKAAGKVYSEEEWNKRQSAWDKQFAVLKTQQENASKLIRESQRQALLQRVEQEGGDKDIAARLFDAEQAIKEREDKIAGREVELAQGAKMLKAHQLMKDLQLPDNVLPSLLEAEDPAVMEKTALTKALELAKAAKVPDRTPVPPTGTPVGEDESKLPLEVRLQKVLGRMEAKK